MSHYSVMVVVPEGSDVETTVDELLAPYDENIEVEEYVKFTRKECAIERKKKIADYKAMLKEKDAEKKYNIQAIKDSIKKYSKMTAKEYFEYMASDYEKKNEKGEPLTTYNPKSKWDWYEIGGRWSGYLMNKHDRVLNVDFARICDIDFDRMAKELIENAKNNWNKAHEKKTTDFEKRFEYGINNGETEESYIKRQSGFHTFAVVTSDGKWHAPSDMGWWGITVNETESENDWDEKFYDRFIKNANPNDTIVIVDCHI